MMKIASRNECTGCGACNNICPRDAINMVYDDEGFLNPIICEGKCIGCNLCNKVCPAMEKEDKSSEDIINPKVVACFTKDDNKRMISTSGGIFSEIAEYVLSLNGIVVGAKFDEDFNVVHECIENKKSLSVLRGSKYPQSDVKLIYREIKILLEKGRYVLFSGTPCQVSALINYLQKPYKKLMCIDLICYGVGSPVIWQKYLCHFFNKKKIKEIVFKDKKYGWHNFHFRLQYPIIALRQPGGVNPYMRGYLDGIFSRESCAKCRYRGIKRKSDFTIADCWGIDRIDKEMDDDGGTSALFIHSVRGNEIFEYIKGRLVYKEISAAILIQNNQHVKKESDYRDKRNAFFEELKKEKFKKVMKKYCTDDTTKCWIKNIWSYTIIKLIYERIK